MTFAGMGAGWGWAGGGGGEGGLVGGGSNNLKIRQKYRKIKGLSNFSIFIFGVPTFYFLKMIMCIW